MPDTASVDAECNEVLRSLRERGRTEARRLFNIGKLSREALPRLLHAIAYGVAPSGVKFVFLDGSAASAAFPSRAPRPGREPLIVLPFALMPYDRAFARPSRAFLDDLARFILFRDPVLPRGVPDAEMEELVYRRARAFLAEAAFPEEVTLGLLLNEERAPLLTGFLRALLDHGAPRLVLYELSTRVTRAAGVPSDDHMRIDSVTLGPFVAVNRWE